MDSGINDEIIKRRLLIDGDGAGDDRRIVALTKAFINWCNSDETEEECDSAYRRILGQVSQVEYSARRSHAAIETSVKAKEMYDTLAEEIKEEIDNTRDEIKLAKDVLAQASTYRKHSLEFDALGKLVETTPDRIKTEERVAELRKELDGCQKQKDKLATRLEKRKKQMYVIAVAMDELEEVVKSDEALEGEAMPGPLEGSTKPDGNKDGENDFTDGAMDMDTDPPAGQSNTEQTSPVQQTPQASPEGSTILGIVTSVPVSPSQKKHEKYDELSDGSDAEEKP